MWEDDHVATDLESRLRRLEGAKEDILRLAGGITEAYGGLLYPLDLVAYAVLKRTLALIAGFSAHIRAKNFTCAASLLRLHLDSLLRWSAFSFTADCQALAKAVLAGEHIRNLRAEDGKFLTDTYLVDRVAATCPWVRRVYKQTSGYIHLSRKHVSNTMTPTGNKEGMTIVIGAEDEASVTETHRIEACAAMQHITELLLRWVEDYRATKDNPRELNSITE
jgi:hypothetical protein